MTVAKSGYIVGKEGFGFCGDSTKIALNKQQRRFHKTFLECASDVRQKLIVSTNDIGVLTHSATCSRVRGKLEDRPVSFFVWCVPGKKPGPLSFCKATLFKRNVSDGVGDTARRAVVFLIL